MWYTPSPAGGSSNNGDSNDGDSAENSDGSGFDADAFSPSSLPNSKDQDLFDRVEAAEEEQKNGVNVIIGVVIGVVLIGIGIVGGVIFYLHRSVSKGKQQQSSLASKTDTNEAWSFTNDKMDENSEWTVHIDPASGTSYYAHKKTGRTTWSDPRGIELASLSNPMDGIELSTNPVKVKAKSNV